MKRTLGAMLLAATSAAYSAPPATPVLSPPGWLCGATGGGSPQWTMEADGSGAPVRQVLKQSGVAPYPWCVKPDVRLADGFVDVRFKPISGKEDQAGGVVWRWQDTDNYYVVRANALENNVSLYATQGGNRRTLLYVDAPVAGNTWHRLRVEFKDTNIQVFLDGKRYINIDDSRIRSPGSVGVWTKADSVTLFDDFQSDVTAHGKQ